MKKVKFSQILDFQKKSHIKAGDGLKNGSFPFFTSSPVLSKYVDSFQFGSPSLIFGTGGSASVHICENSFSVSTDCLVAQLKPEAVKRFDIKFIYYYLFGNIEILENGFKGAGLKHISKGYINNIDIPELSFEDQKRIVKILDKADNLKQKRKEVIKSLDDYLKSVFLDMFGDPVKNEKKWELKTIGQLVKENKHSIKRGPFGGALKKEIFVDDGYLVYEQFHALNNDFTMERYFVDEKKFQELKAFEVEANDIIISCSGIYLGKLAIVPENYKKGIINQALLKITLDNLKMTNLLFINIFTNTNFKNKFFGNKIGSGIPNFPPMQQFKKFTFICPPIELQNKFTGIVKKLEEIKQKMLIQSTELENEFQSLTQKAFKGEL